LQKHQDTVKSRKVIESLLFDGSMTIETNSFETMKPKNIVYGNRKT